ncbi:MAG: restriction endonuclease subunit S, partial [Lentisphaeria bacterium]|nr:restriction endonuclease subunit S [Lentisphaeria bacterium]
MNRATLPEGWEIKRMPDVVKWGSGGTPKATEKSFYDGGTISWLVIGDLNDGIVTSSTSKITPLGLENSNAKMIPHGTLLVAMYGSIGKLGITGMECCTNQAIAFAKELFGVSVKYMFYFLSMRKSYLISKGKGGTQKNISLTVLNSLDVIVPPLSEQERIVSRIEELFSQLDAAFAELQTVKEKLNVYRQAVLKSAFEGRLTEKWRKKKLQSSKQDLQKIYRSNVVFKDISGDQNEYQLSKPTEWGTIRLGNIFDIEVGGTPQRNVAEYWGKGIPWVSS